jgi:hypothetical protein
MYGFRASRNAQFLAGVGNSDFRAERFWNAFAVGWRRVYWLPATAAVADMPVGAPSPFASVLEQAPDDMRTSGAWPGSTMKTSAVVESRSSPSAPPTRRIPERVEPRVTLICRQQWFSPCVLGRYGALHSHQNTTYGRRRSRLGPWHSRAFRLISVDLGRCGGVPCIRSFRIPVGTVVSMVGEARRMNRSSPTFLSLSSRIFARPCSTRSKPCGHVSCRRYRRTPKGSSST